MDKTKKEQRVCAIILMTIFGIAFFSICARFVIKNVVNEMLGIDNSFVRFWLPDDETLNTSEENGTSDEKVSIDWENLYPYRDIQVSGDVQRSPLTEKYLAKVEVIKSKLDVYTNKLFLLQQQCAVANNIYQACIDWKLASPGEDGVIFMYNNYLASTSGRVSDKDIEEIADSVSEFGEYLKNQDIPLIYANAGTDVCPYDKQIYNTFLENSNENADALTTALRERGVDTIDFREEMQKEGIDWYTDGFYYRTDHHWTNLAGLWAAGILAQKMNDDYGFSFDSKYFNSSEYDIAHYPNYWLGYRGRKVTLAKTDLDDFDMIIPAFSTDFNVEVPEKGISISGDYKTSIIEMEDFQEVGTYSWYEYLNKISAYECTTTALTTEVTIHNNQKTNNDGKRILILRDSYANYLMSYRAGDGDEPMALGAFPGSIHTFVEEYKPDMVIILHYSNSITPIDWATQKHFYYF